MSEQPEEKKALDLDQLVQQKREARKQELLAKKEERDAKKQKQLQDGHRSSNITIIKREVSHSVVIKGLPRVEDREVQRLVFDTIHVKNAPCFRRGSTWTVRLNSMQKAQQLVRELDGSDCKESQQILRVYLQK